MADDDEYEEESTYVVLDLGNEMSQETFERMTHAEQSLSIAGIDTNTPYVQFGGMTFKGEIDEKIGTDVLFEITERKREPTGLLPLLTTMRTDESDPTRQFHLSTSFTTMTNKIIKCEQVGLVPRTQQCTDDRSQINPPKTETMP